MTHVSFCPKIHPGRPLPQVPATSVVYQTDMAATLRRQFRHPVDILIAVREQKEIDLRIALQGSVQSRDKGVLAIPPMSLGEIPCGVIISFQVGQRELLGSPLLKRRHIIADCEGGAPLFAERRASIPENSLGQGNDYRICQAGE